MWVERTIERGVSSRLGEAGGHCRMNSRFLRTGGSVDAERSHGRAKRLMPLLQGFAVDNDGINHRLGSVKYKKGRGGVIDGVYGCERCWCR